MARTLYFTHPMFTLALNQARQLQREHSIIKGNNLVNSPEKPSYYRDGYLQVEANIEKIAASFRKELTKQGAKSRASGVRFVDAGVLFPSFASRLRHIAVLRLRLYLDDSGSQTQTSAFVMAGWIASEKKWKRFEREWQLALDEAGIDIFHATDFFNRKGTCNAKGDRYEEWSDEKHIHFARRFAAIAANPRHNCAGVGRGIDVSAYRDLILPQPLFPNTPHDRFTPILFCTQTCLEWTAKTLGPLLPEGDQIAVYFEQGRGVGETIEWCGYLQEHTSWGSLYCSFTPGSKSALPLQAADLLAHETWRHIKERINPTGRPLRKSFQRLLRGERISINMGTREQFLACLEFIKRFLADSNG